MDAKAIKAGLTPLFLPAPPMFERSVGYTGQSLRVAFYWGPCDELCFCDDLMNSGAIDSAGWLFFMDHPSVKRHLHPYDFGSADLPARHWLLLHRKKRRFYVGESAVVEKFLEALALPGKKPDSPAGEKTTITLDECIMLAGNIEELLKKELSPEETIRRLGKQQSVCAELRRWLEKLR